jgi:hypothetical protein
MAIAEAIFALLDGAAGLTALTSHRIYPVNAAQSATLPFVVYREVSAERISAMGVDTGMVRPRYQVSVFASSWSSARAVAVQVRLALQRFRGTSAGVTIEEIFMLNSLELTDDNIEVKQVVMDFEINHRE